jgi:hypothetical protein
MAGDSANIQQFKHSVVRFFNHRGSQIGASDRGIITRFIIEYAFDSLNEENDYRDEDECVWSTTSELG